MVERLGSASMRWFVRGSRDATKAMGKRMFWEWWLVATSGARAGTDLTWLAGVQSWHGATHMEAQSQARSVWGPSRANCPARSAWERKRVWRYLGTGEFESKSKRHCGDALVPRPSTGELFHAQSVTIGLIVVWCRQGMTIEYVLTRVPRVFGVTPKPARS